MPHASTIAIAGVVLLAVHVAESSAFQQQPVEASDEQRLDELRLVDTPAWDGLDWRSRRAAAPSSRRASGADG